MDLTTKMVEDLIYLQQAGMTDRQLRELHHPQAEPETFARALLYFRKGGELRDKNAAYAGRVAHVADEHRRIVHDFQPLVDGAKRHRPSTHSL